MACPSATDADIKEIADNSLSFAVTCKHFVRPFRYCRKPGRTDKTSFIYSSSPVLSSSSKLRVYDGSAAS